MKKTLLALVTSAFLVMPQMAMATNSSNASDTSNVALDAQVCQKVSPSIEAMRENLHSNYMPNFLPVLMNSQEALGLTGAQCAKLNTFKKDKASKGKMVIKKVHQLEAESHDLALNGASLENILARHQDIAVLREKIVKGKMGCQKFVKSVLTEAQFEQFLDIYKQKRAQALQKLATK